MNPRVITAATGTIILACGLAGLLYPERVMGILGYTILPGAQPATVLGEVRATYGGLFVVMGVFTLLATIDPAAQRARLTFVGLLWLGAGAGRLLGTSLDGSPGLLGWIGVALEALMGIALLAAGWIRPRAVQAPAAALPSAATPSPPPAQV